MVRKAQLYLSFHIRYVLKYPANNGYLAFHKSVPFHIQKMILCSAAQS